MTDPATDLGRALDAMHRAILKADLPALGVLGGEVEALLADFAPLSDQAAALALHRQASRNAACLAAAARGMRAALRRLAEVATASTGIGSYDAKGRRPMVPITAERLIRRV